VLTRCPSLISTHSRLLDGGKGVTKSVDLQALPASAAASATLAGRFGASQAAASGGVRAQSGPTYRYTTAAAAGGRSSPTLRQLTAALKVQRGCCRGAPPVQRRAAAAAHLLDR
jgi:hypothetical protein